MSVVRASFGRRLGEAMASRGPLCVGIDPHPALLNAWDLPDDVVGLERFAMTTIEALAGEVAMLKPQSAFFEAHGSAGIAVLERTITEARQAGALVLLDAKRGDIGSTMSAYCSAYLDERSTLAADAVTFSPYLGFGSLAPALGSAEQTGRGVFVLARTSNPEGGGLQRAVTESGRSVAQSIVDSAADNNALAVGEPEGHPDRPMGHVGVVVGATVRSGELDFSRLGGPILAPGLGAQGGGVQGMRSIFGPAMPHVLPVAAREVLRHGPDGKGLRNATRRLRDEFAALADR